MGSVINKKFLNGEARDIEDIVRLRPWIEDEWKNLHGDFKNSKLTTDYDAKRNVFKFKLTFFL